MRDREEKGIMWGVKGCVKEVDNIFKLIVKNSPFLKALSDAINPEPNYKKEIYKTLNEISAILKNDSKRVNPAEGKDGLAM